MDLKGKIHFTFNAVFLKGIKNEEFVISKHFNTKLDYVQERNDSTEPFCKRTTFTQHPTIELRPTGQTGTPIISSVRVRNRVDVFVNKSNVLLKSTLQAKGR